MEFNILSLCFLLLLLHSVSGEMSPDVVFDVLSRRIDAVLVGRNDDIRRVVDEVVEEKINKLEKRMEQRFKHIERENKDNLEKINEDFANCKKCVEPQFQKNKNKGEYDIEESMKTELNQLKLVTHRFLSSEKAFLRTMMAHSRVEMTSNIKDVQLRLEAFNQTLVSSNQSVHETFSDIKDEIQRKYETIDHKSKLRDDAIVDEINSLKILINETEHERTGEMTDTIETAQDQYKSMADKTNAVIARIKEDINVNQNVLRLQLQSNFNKMRSEIRNRHAFIGFSARLSSSSKSSFDYGRSEVIKFDDVVYDNVRAYDKSTGIFTVPVGGWYMFIYFVENTSAGDCHVLLYKNSRYQSNAVASEGYDSMGGNAIILPAEEGDRVWIQTGSFKSKYSIVNRHRTTFTGLLIERSEF